MRFALALVLCVGCGGRGESTVADSAIAPSEDSVVATDAAMDEPPVDTTVFSDTTVTVDSWSEDVAIDTFVPPDAPAVVDGSYVFPPCDDCVVDDGAQSPF